MKYNLIFLLFMTSRSLFLNSSSADAIPEGQKRAYEISSKLKANRKVTSGLALKMCTVR